MKSEIVLRPRVSLMSSEVWHSKLVIDDEKLTEQKDASQLEESHTHAKSDLMLVNEKKAMRELLEIVHIAKGEPKILSMPKYTYKPELFGCNNVKVNQGSSEWQASILVRLLQSERIYSLLVLHPQQY